MSPDYHRWLRYLNATGSDVYRSLNTCKEHARGGTNEDLKEIRPPLPRSGRKRHAEARSDSPRQGGPAPNYVLSTSPGKFQVIWRVESIGQDQAETMLRDLAARYGGGRAATDSARVFRLRALATKSTGRMSKSASAARRRRRGCTPAKSSEFTARNEAVPLRRDRTGASLPPKRGSAVGKTKRGKETKWMVVVDGRGVPLGVKLYAASPSEVRLAEETLETIRVGRRHQGGPPRQKPERVITDKGYDSDALRGRLRQRGVALIAPHRSNRCRKTVECSAVTRSAGSSNAASVGWATIGDWSFATTDR